MITRFRVKNYKCLGDVDFPLTPIHVIIGQNDSGKTSVLEAMGAISQSTNYDLISALPRYTKDQKLKLTGSDMLNIEMSIEFERDHLIFLQRHTYSVILNLGKDDILTYVLEETLDGESLEFPQGVSFSPHRSGKTYVYLMNWLKSTGRLDSLNEKISMISNTLFPFLIIGFSPLKMSCPSPININTTFHLNPDGFGLASLLDDILKYEPDLFVYIRNQFCRFYPQFSSLRLAYKEDIPSPADTENQKRASQVNVALYLTLSSGYEIEAIQLSDGAILFLGFLALMYNPKPPKLIMIEEPEKGIYPKRLEEVIGMMRKLVENPGDRPVPQIVMTTHSPYLLSLFQPEEVTFLRREGGTGPVRAYPMRDAPHIHERLGNGSFYLGELWYNLTEEELFADGK